MVTVFPNGVQKPWPDQQLCIALQKHAAQSDFSKELLVSQLTVILENLLHHLEFISMDFCHMQLTVHKTQRIFLELTALLNYHNYFHPILSLTQPPTPTQIHLPLQKSWGPLLQILQCAISFPGWHPSLAREAKLSALYNLHEGACTYHLGTRRWVLHSRPSYSSFASCYLSWKWWSHWQISSDSKTCPTLSAVSESISVHPCQN